MGLAGLAVLDESAPYATPLPGTAAVPDVPDVPEVTDLLPEIRFFFAMKIKRSSESLETVCLAIRLFDYSVARIFSGSNADQL